MTDISLQQAEHDLLTLHRQRVALEGFQQLMEGREVITGPTAMAMRIAMEDAFESKDKDQAVTGKDITTVIMKIGVTIKNIIQWLLRTIGSLFESLGLAMQKLGQRGKKLKSDLSHMSEEAKSGMGGPDSVIPAETTFNTTALSIGGEFVGQDPEQLNNVIKMGDYINGTYPKMFDSLMGKVEQLAKSHMDDDTSESFFKSLAEVLRSSFVKPPIQLDSELFAPALGEEVINTVPLMGDRGMVMFDPRALSSLNENDPIRQLTGLLVLKFPEYSTKQNGPEEVAVVDYATAVKLADMVNKSIDANNNGASDVRALMGRHAATLNKIVAEIEANPKAGARGEIAEAIGIMLQRFAAFLVEVHGWYGRTLNQELGYLSLCIKATGSEDE